MSGTAICEFCVFRKESTLHLVLRLRGDPGTQKADKEDAFESLEGLATKGLAEHVLYHVADKAQTVTLPHCCISLCSAKE